MQVRRAPITVPAIGSWHVPCDTSCPELHVNGAIANRTSYVAGCPVPSFTSVKDRVTELAVGEATARSLTVPGGDGGGGGGGGGGTADTVTADVSASDPPFCLAITR